MFAATQALGWALFSSSLVCLIHLALQAARGMAYCLRCWVYATGSVMLASQIVRALLPSRLSMHAPCLAHACLRMHMLLNIRCMYHKLGKASGLCGALLQKWCFL